MLLRVLALELELVQRLLELRQLLLMQPELRQLLLVLTMLVLTLQLRLGSSLPPWQLLQQQQQQEQQQRLSMRLPTASFHCAAVPRRYLSRLLLTAAHSHWQPSLRWTHSGHCCAVHSHSSAHQHPSHCRHSCLPTPPHSAHRRLLLPEAMRAFPPCLLVRFSLP